jgi:hypothetical protein
MSAKTLTKAVAIREGLADFQEQEREAWRAYEEANACHCCCCTGECSYAFQESTPEEQEAWMRNYWDWWENR